MDDNSPASFHSFRLAVLGWTQQEISDQLVALWPDAKGMSQQSVANLLPENGNSGFLVNILSALSGGTPLATVAKRNGLPEIIVWAMKLKELDDEAKLKGLEIPVQSYDVDTFSPQRISYDHVCHMIRKG